MIFRKTLTIVTAMTLYATAALASQSAVQEVDYVIDQGEMYFYAKAPALVPVGDETGALVAAITSALRPVLAYEQRLDGAVAQLDEFWWDESHRIGDRWYTNVNGASLEETSLSSLSVEIDSSRFVTVNAVVNAANATRAKLALVTIAANVGAINPTGYQLRVTFEGLPASEQLNQRSYGKREIASIEAELYLGGRTHDVVLDAHVPVSNMQFDKPCPGKYQSYAMVGIGWMAASRASMNPVLASSMVQNPAAEGYGEPSMVRGVAYVNINELSKMGVSFEYVDEDFSQEYPIATVSLQADNAAQQQAGPTEAMQFAMWAIAKNYSFGRTFLLKFKLPNSAVDEFEELDLQKLADLEQRLFDASCSANAKSDDGFGMMPEETSGCSLGNTPSANGLWLLGLLGLALIRRRRS